MTGFALLDVAIGIIFVILAFSLLASALQEVLASLLNWRGVTLRRGLFRLLEGVAEKGAQSDLFNATLLTSERLDKVPLAVGFLKDPAIRSLHGPESIPGRLKRWLFSWIRSETRDELAALGRMPSSMSKETFARAFVDTLMKDVKKAYGEVDLVEGDATVAVDATKQLLSKWATDIDDGMTAVRKTVEALPMDQQLRERVLRTLREVSVSRELQERMQIFDAAADDVRQEVEARIARAQKALDETLAAVGAWFDQTMDRVTGWYVRRAKYVMFLIGFLMAAGMNFDLIGYAGQLINNESLRNQIVARAELAVANGAVGQLVVDNKAELRLLALGIDQDGVRPDGSRRITADELRAYPFTPGELQLLGLSADALAGQGLTDAQIAAAIVTLEEVANDTRVDANNDGEISPEEADAAIEATLQRVRNTMDLSVETLTEQLGGEGVTMGWSCEADGIFDDKLYKCIWESAWPSGFFSWLLIGLGCTLGGQFWFDFLQQIVRVKTAASGINSDVKRQTGATGGKIQGP